MIALGIESRKLFETTYAAKIIPTRATANTHHFNRVKVERGDDIFLVSRVFATVQHIYRMRDYINDKFEALHCALGTSRQANHERLADDSGEVA
jgi:hypothetical protein